MYHVSSDGRVRKCNSNVRKCPLLKYGENIVHFDTDNLGDAKVQYEKLLRGENNVFSQTRNVYSIVDNDNKDYDEGFVNSYTLMTNDVDEDGIYSYKGKEYYRNVPISHKKIARNSSSRLRSLDAVDESKYLLSSSLDNIMVDAVNAKFLQRLKDGSYVEQTHSSLIKTYSFYSVKLLELVEHNKMINIPSGYSVEKLKNQLNEIDDLQSQRPLKVAPVFEKYEQFFKDVNFILSSKAGRREKTRWNLKKEYMNSYYAKDTKNSYYHHYADNALPEIGKIQSHTEQQQTYNNKPYGVLWLTTGSLDSETNTVKSSWGEWKYYNMFGKTQNLAQGTLQKNALILELKESNLRYLDKVLRNNNMLIFNSTERFSLNKYADNNGNYYQIDWATLKEHGVDAVRINGEIEKDYFYGYDVDTLVLLNGDSLNKWDKVEPFNYENNNYENNNNY